MLIYITICCIDLKIDINGEHWLVYDNVHSHFHVIINIRKFFGANNYCNACCRCFKSANTCNNLFHGLCSILSDEKIQPVNKSNRLANDCNHYMHGEIMKGSDAEIKHNSENTKLPLQDIEDNITHPNYIIFDFETDTSKTIL